MAVEVSYKLALVLVQVIAVSEIGVTEPREDLAVLAFDDATVYGVVAFDDHSGEDLAEGLVHFQDGLFEDLQLFDVRPPLGFLFLLGSTPGQSFPFRFADIVEVQFVEVVFLFDMGVGRSVGEVAFAAAAGKISALWVALGSSRVLLGLHFNYRTDA
jgi:hypothetical protein